MDEIVYVDQPLRAGKGRITTTITEHGGNVATALVAVAKLGGKAGFIGWLSDQPGNDVGARELARQGVNINLAPRHKDAKPISALITVGTDGDRFIAFDDNVLHGTSAALPDEIIAQAKVLMIDGYATHALAFVARARQLGLAVVADIEWTIGAATDSAIALANHLVLPIGFAQTYSSEREPAAIIRKLWSADRAAVILTDSEKGSYVQQKGDETLWHIPAHKVVAVDTTGAGDCYHGAYAFALTRGEPPMSAARFATAAAALSVTGKGGRGALPSYEACLSLMKSKDSVEPVPLSRDDN